MITEQIITMLKDVIGDKLLAADSKSAHRLYIYIEPSTVRDASRLFYQQLGARFQIATGVDTPAGIEVMYHWALDAEGLVVTLRALLNHESPQVDSIATMCPAAEWIEREMWELLGIDFHDHPDLRHLLLDDDWPKGNYPLRRDRRLAP